MPVGIDDDRVDQDVAPLAAVGARVHPDPAAGRARDRRGELEAAEARGARAMEADGVRRAAARDEDVALDVRRREIARELEHERVDAVVVDEHVRAEPDRSTHGRPLLGAQRSDRPAARRASPGARTSAPARRCRSSCSARARRSLPSAANLASEQADRAVDVARADDEQHVARPRASGEPRRPLLDRRRPRREHAAVAQRVDDELAVTPVTGCSRAG